MNMMKRFAQWFLTLSRPGKIFFIVGIVALGWFGSTKLLGKSSSTPTYQTATAEKGTLVVSVTASGQISAANSASVTTQTSGVVNKIFVQNGQHVNSGDAVAQVDLDMEGKQRSAQGYASYLGAKTAMENANTTYYTLQSDLFTKWKTFTDLSESSGYTNGDGSPNTQKREQAAFISTNDNWLAAEAKYKTQQQVVLQAQSSLNSAWASYQQSSPTIYAPISGTLSGLSLQLGSVLTAQTGSSGNSTSQRIANIKTDATPMATVNLSEIDVSKVAVGNKATLTMTAFPDKTFTGKVVSIDTTGSVSSGVTTYPAYISFDEVQEGIYPNMGIDAKIITQVKNDIVSVPNAAVQTTNGQKTIRVMNKGTMTSVSVETGVTNDTNTEITSGINEGDSVVTSFITATTSQTRTTTASPFGGGGLGGGGRVFGGGGGR